MIDEIYCINIRKRPDRKEDVIREMGRAGIHRLHKEVKFTTDWDNNLNGEDITDEWLKENGFGLFNWKLKEDVAINIDIDWALWWKRDLTRGEIGCTISHTEIWKRAKGYTLILEDDVYSEPNWIINLEQAINNLNKIDKDWDLLYLGREPQDPDEEVVCNGIVKPKYSFCTFAYMLSPSGIKKILKYEVDKCIIPADEILPATYIKHPRPDVRLKYPPSLNAYAMKPRVIKQRPKKDVGSDTEL